ncbi:MAG: cell division protein FtsQ/DivIB [Aestuariivita sp.]|nr:cell division protein FtsQ/DivIB [Aestuariivita sp.]MCY4345578.1 cell division protein FtsQ/DivIB [Aestuariivita sp.]
MNSFFLSDPGRSRLKYRLQRWLLTPLRRRILIIALFLVSAGAGAWVFLSDETRLESVHQLVVDLRSAIEQSPEFMVQLISVDGASPEVSREIHEMLPLEFPISSFDLDLDSIREQISALSVVKEARVRIRHRGILQVDVTERVAVVIWRTAEGLRLLDDEGEITGSLQFRHERPDLAIIAGFGANAHVREALELISAAEPFRERLRGLVRVGERRWDVFLNRGQRIMLPADEPIPALERVIALSDADDMMERDLQLVDMRLSNRPTIRMSDQAVRAWWQIQEHNRSQLQRSN